MFFWRNWVGIQSGPSRAPIFAFLGTAFGSRDPVGHQFSNFWHHVWTCREATKITQKHAKTLQKCYFLWIWLPPDIGARLDPDWIPAGSRLDPNLPKAVPKNAKIGARLGPDGILTGSIDRQEPTPTPIFPFPDPPLPLFSFSAHQPCTNTSPSCTKTAKAVLSQTGVLQVLSVFLCFCWHFKKKRFGTGNSQTRDHTSFHHTAIKHDHLDDSDNFRSPEETLYMATGMAPLPYGSPI